MKRILIAILMTMVAASCKDEKEEPINLAVELMGKVTTNDEFGFSLDEQQGVSVNVMGVSPAVSSITDEEGNYLINNLRSGTYNLQFTKDGFGSHVVPGLKLIGGKHPAYLNFIVTQTSSTTFEDLQLAFNTEVLELQGKVNHTYPFNTALNGPRVIFFIGKEEGVSGDNYTQSVSRIINQESGSSVMISQIFDKDLFPSGTTIYIIAYGVANYDNGYLDILTNRTIYPTLSQTSSNIASITVP